MRQRLGGAIAISATTHYQLSNRVSWAWRVAEAGCPVALLYLGFVGDTYFRDYLTDDGHWQRVMGAYMNGVMPLNLPGRVVDLSNGGSFMLLVKSLPVRAISG